MLQVSQNRLRRVSPRVRTLRPPCWIYRSPLSSAVFYCSARDWWRLMADEDGEGLLQKQETTSSTKTSKRKLKRLQVSRQYLELLIYLSIEINIMLSWRREYTEVLSIIHRCTHCTQLYCKVFIVDFYILTRSIRWEIGSFKGVRARLTWSNKWNKIW